jgi:signal transduction histidine kinase
MLNHLFRRVTHYKEVVLLVIVGIAGLYLMESLLVKGFEKDEYHEAELTADRIHAKVQSSLEEHVTALIALKVIYENFDDITPRDFTQYGGSITSTLSGFKRLMYIDQSNIIRRVYPQTPENKGLNNYPLSGSGEADFAKILTEARKPERSGQGQSVSRLISFLGNSKSFWAVIPIYRDKDKKHKKEFLGFAAGELSIETVWRLTEEPLDHFQVQLIDPDGNRVLKGINMHDRKSVSQFEFMLLEQPWHIQLRSLHNNLQKQLLQRIALWLGGLIILGLIVLLILSSKRHKNELFYVNQQFETIFNASPDGILLLDDKLNIQLANPVAANWVSQPAEKIQEQAFFSLFACNCPNLAKCRSLSHLLCTTGEFTQDLPDILETTVIKSNGQESAATLRLSAAKIKSKRKGKSLNQFICVLGDITASKELEKVKENYVATLTHDLKTPLLAQKMVLNNILESNLISHFPDVQKGLLLGAVESVQDLLDMVNSTLLFYKLESSHLQLSKQYHPLKKLLKDVLTDIQPLAEKRGLTIALDGPVDMPDMLIDPIQMKRVFQNLLSNALHHSYKQSVIHVRLAYSPDGQSALVDIINEGPGIPEELQAKIFDKYYTLSRRFKQIGTGLGLYIARSVTKLHGGDLQVRSELNKETCFTVSLPISQIIRAKPVEKIPSEHSYL